MSGQPTRAGVIPRTIDEWRSFGAFLRRPALPPRANIALGETVRVLPKLFVLDMLLMIAVLGGIGLATALGVKLPDHMLGEMKLSPGLVAAIVVGAPFGEEILFRGWLSGRPGHVVSVLALLAGGVVFAIGGTTVVKAAGLALGLVVAIAALFVWRRRLAMGWFQRHFPWFFYASALLFALVHLTNFAGAGASPALVALVLPQFVLALLLGYLRVNRGLMAGVALHMLHNAVFAAVMIAGATAA